MEDMFAMICSLGAVDLSNMLHCLALMGLVVFARFVLMTDSGFVKNKMLQLQGILLAKIGIKQ